VSVRQFIAIAILGLVAVACGSNPAQTVVPSPSPTPRPAPTPTPQPTPTPGNPWVSLRARDYSYNINADVPGCGGRGGLTCGENVPGTLAVYPADTKVFITCDPLDANGVPTENHPREPEVIVQWTYYITPPFNLTPPNDFRLEEEDYFNEGHNTFNASIIFRNSAPTGSVGVSCGFRGVVSPILTLRVSPR